MPKKLEPLNWVTVQRKVSDLIPVDFNPRTISEGDLQDLKESLAEFNLVDIPVVDFDDSIISGHQRIKALFILERGDEVIDVRMPNRKLEEKEFKKYMMLANSHAGKFDFQKVEDYFQEIDLAAISGFDSEEYEKFLDMKTPVFIPGEEDDFDETPPEIPETVLGDLYEIGEHRLLCGDSTDSDQVAKLMNGEKADMVFTSPPYNQGNGGMKYDYNGDVKKLYQQKTDKKTKEEYFDFCISILSSISIIIKNNGALFWNVAYNANARDDYGKIVFSKNNPFSVQETIIWDKTHSFPTASKGILSRRCEFVFLMSKEKYTTNQGENEPIDNMWVISSNGAQHDIHKACFPIELPSKGIILCSKQGDTIYEPFTGSGSTMVASHQLKRKCYGLELDPKYCDVIVKRILKLDPSLIIKKNGKEETAFWLNKINENA